MTKQKTERLRMLISIPTEIKREAHARTTTCMNDEIVGALAEHYGVPFVPSGRVGSRQVKLEDGKMLLRVPGVLRDKVVMDAVRKRTNQTERVNSILAERYGVSYEPVAARRAPIGRRDASVAA